MRRRTVLAMSIVLPWGTPAAHAQDFPSRPVRMVLPQGPGGGPDGLARALAEVLTPILGQAVVVDNRPGANGSVAASHLLSQPADGHTLFLAGVSNMAWNPLIYRQLSYQPSRDLVGVALLASTRYLTVAAPQLGVRSLPELIAKARAEPGRIDFASIGMGNSTHLATELLMKRTGIQMQHVPFGSAPGATFYSSLVSGQTPVMTSIPADLVPLATTGKVVPLAVTGAQRMAELPEVPTFKELGIEMEVPGWFALVARAGTPAAVIERLNAAVNQAMATPRMRQLLGAQMLDPLSGPPAEVERLTRRDTDTWAPLIASMNLPR